MEVASSAIGIQFFEDALDERLGAGGLFSHDAFTCCLPRKPETKPLTKLVEKKPKKLTEIEAGLD